MGIVLLGVCFYALIVRVYRAFLNPLSKIPGPKLATITQGYEMYFDLVQKARFPWHLRKLHEQYGRRDHFETIAVTDNQVGPIVRIFPSEVHTNDPSYAETHFSGSIKMNKYAPHQNQFGMPESSFNTVHADLHKIRRGALAPFFSRRSINALESTLVEKVDLTC